MNWYQQGDLIIKPCDTIPVRVCPVASTVLAEGEATGHRHEAVGAAIRVFHQGPDRYLEAPSGARITHPEHRTVEVPPGQYRIGFVREFNHFRGEFSNPKD